MMIPTIAERARDVPSCSSVSSLWRKPVVWIALGALVIAGLAANLSWVVAAGAVPIVIGVLPCLAMCALHLCYMRKAPDRPADASWAEGTPRR